MFGTTRTSSSKSRRSTTKLHCSGVPVALACPPPRSTTETPSAFNKSSKGDFLTSIFSAKTRVLSSRDNCSNPNGKSTRESHWRTRVTSCPPGVLSIASFPSGVITITIRTSNLVVLNRIFLLVPPEPPSTTIS